jgi:cytoskeletal protein RodZ
VSIGKALADAREAAGLSVDEVAHATRIRRTLVLGIENDDFSACGGDFYARGHVRTIATKVGLDPAPLLAEFDRERPEAAPPRASDVFEAETAARPERRGPNWSAAMVAALVFIVAFGIYHAFTGSGGGDNRFRTLPSTLAPGPSSAAPSGSPSPSGNSGGGSAVAQAPRTKVVVAVRADERSWVQVNTGTGQQLFQGLLQGGETRTFTDRREIKLVVGNAGGVNLTVNGTDIGPPGRRGQVARVQFTPQDPTGG